MVRPADEDAVRATEQPDEPAAGVLVPRNRIDPRGCDADLAGVPPLADPFEEVDPVEDRPIQLREVFGNGCDWLNRQGWGSRGRPRLHHADLGARRKNKE
ncbi:MAG TPA: hypothetical protein VFY18_09045 [Candidatus Limnocylindrales bacterium]|nr:hypothetical protein [Candidatus Limnocylindrales bacterium]